MKQKMLKISAVIILVGIGVNYVTSRTAKLGLRVAIDSPAALETDGTYRFIGSSTRHTLAQFEGTDYKITIIPFDWLEYDLRVTHTAFVRSEGHEVWFRLRIYPYGPPFDIVGFSDRMR